LPCLPLPCLPLPSFALPCLLSLYVSVILSCFYSLFQSKHLLVGETKDAP
jgi:hypothetical protein